MALDIFKSSNPVGWFTQHENMEIPQKKDEKASD